MHFCIRYWYCALVSIFLASSCVAQEDEVSKWFGTTSDLGFGSSIATGADFDADGAHDLLVLSSYDSTTYSSVRTFKTNRSPIYTVVPSVTPRSIGLIPDINSDGVLDFVVGAHGNSCTSSTEVPKLFFYSGSNGNLLHTVNGPVKSWYGDGIQVIGDKIIVTAFRETQVNPPQQYGQCDTAIGAFYVVSASTRQTLYSATGTYYGQNFARYVGKVGDINNDGVTDFAVGNGGGACAICLAEYKIYSGAATTATVLLTSGIDSNVMTFEPFRDFNSDGYVDFLVGGPRTSTSTANNIGEVDIVSGYNGAVLSQLWGEKPYSFFGTAIKTLGDINSDGYTDFAVIASGDGGNARAYITYFSGANLSQLYVNYENYSDFPGDSLPVEIALPGDLNLDGKPDLLVGTPFDTQYEASSMRGSIRVSTTASCEMLPVPYVGQMCL